MLQIMQVASIDTATHLFCEETNYNVQKRSLQYK